MSDLETKAIDLLDKLDTLTTQYTPEVIDSAMTAVSITAIGNIIWGLLSLVSAGAVWWLAKNFMSYCRTKKQQDGWMSDWELGFSLSFAVGGISCVFLTLACLGNLFDVWNWVAIFNPKLALAHKLLGL